LLVDFLCH
jgi:L-ascorbate metabolism protein UlaG (beta-lactamase superfamily)